MNANTQHEICRCDHCRARHVGLEMDRVALLTKVVYGGSGIHVLIMLHVDDDVEVSLHVVRVAVALGPHDVCKGPERRKS